MPDTEPPGAVPERTRTRTKAKVRERVKLGPGPGHLVRRWWGRNGVTVLLWAGMVLGGLGLVALVMNGFITSSAPPPPQ